MRNRQIRMGQTFLFEVMEALGYSPGKDGICFGIAMMGLQAILTNEIHALDARLEACSHAPINKLCTNPSPDLLAFFDGVTLYQDPKKFSHLILNNNNNLLVYQRLNHFHYMNMILFFVKWSLI